MIRVGNQFEEAFTGGASNPKFLVVDLVKDPDVLGSLTRSTTLTLNLDPDGPPTLF
jgi:hypothetical protein